MRFALLLLGSLCLSAQNDAESMHIQNVELTLHPRVMVQLHSRLRTRNEYREFFQTRLGPIVNLQVTKRVTAIGGYYYIDQRYKPASGPRWEDYNRYFAGGSVRWFKTTNWTLDSRHLAEQFLAVPGGDYRRYRNRSIVSRYWKDWQLLQSSEILYAQRTPTYRIGAHVLRRMNRNLLLGVGYEIRQNQNRSLSHVVVTNVTYQTGWRD